MSQEHQITIAMVDDHYQHRNGICEFLEQLGLTVLFQAENGKAALEKLESGLLPDVCIIDVNMPVMDGFETARAIRRKFPMQKIMAYSMNNDEKNVIRMFQSGANGYILKGGDPEELKKAIIALHNKEYYFNSDIGKILLTYLRRSQKDGVF